MPLRVDGKKIINNVRFADNMLLRAKGLMFEKEKNFDYSLIFTFNYESKIGCSLHMLFMNFSVDVLFLNSKKEVVDKVTLKPWLLNYTPKKAAKYVVESPVGTNKKVKLKDKISW